MQFVPEKWEAIRTLMRSEGTDLVRKSPLIRAEYALARRLQDCYSPRHSSELSMEVPIMVNKNEIRERMEVVGSCGNHLGTVDHLDGESIKMTRSDPNANGEHHWVPINWVESVDDKVHLSKNCSEAQNEWSRSTPTGSKL